MAGFPMIDFKATLLDGAYHDVDSSVLAFEIAARAAFKEGMAKAGPQLLEPIMKVEVVTPDEYMGDIIGDLNSRRGQVKIGRASCRERVCQSVWISVVAGSLKKKSTYTKQKA